MERMRNRRRWLWIGLVLLLGACGKGPPSPAGPREGETSPDSAAALRNGDRAPDFEVADLDGGTFQLSSLDGRVRLLDFWATWCAPCRHEIPMLNDLHRRYAESGLSILALSDEEPEIVREFADETDMAYTNLVRASDVAERYGVLALPTAFLVDREGRIVETFFGEKTKDQLEKRIRALLGLEPAA